MRAAVLHTCGAAPKYREFEEPCTEVEMHMGLGYAATAKLAAPACGRRCRSTFAER